MWNSRRQLGKAMLLGGKMGKKGDVPLEGEQ